MKKWLSYRERSLLGRALTLAELTEVMHMARRIASLLLLQPALDANYQTVKAAGYRGYAPQTAHILPGLLIWSRVEPYDSPGTYRFQEENDGPSFPTSSTAT
jgi:hypothetical protein